MTEETKQPTRIKVSVYATREKISIGAAHKRIKRGKVKAERDAVTGWWFIIQEQGQPINPETDAA